MPHFTELAAKRIQEMVAGIPIFMRYLPDIGPNKKPLNRQFLYNVSDLELAGALAAAQAPSYCTNTRPLFV